MSQRKQEDLHYGQTGDTKTMCYTIPCKCNRTLNTRLMKQTGC